MRQLDFFPDTLNKEEERLRDLSKQSFINLWKTELSKMMSYNAAEGLTYQKEKNARAQQRAKLATISKIASERGIKQPTRGYM